MNETLKEIKKFHGHIGPYVIIGYKIGMIANKMLGSDPFSKRVDVWTGTLPPLSCIIDGLQMSSGCTLGKGNIKVHQKNTPKVKFTNKKGETINIILKSEIKDEIDQKVNEENIENFSKKLYKRDDEELFYITKTT